MLDRLFDELFSKGQFHYYYKMTTYSPEEGLKEQVKTNIEGFNSSGYESEQTAKIKATIAEKKRELQTVIANENFERAIELREELKNFAVQLESAVQSDKEEIEKRKTTKEIFSDLQSKLAKTIKDENYEESAKIRDEIKALKDKVA